MDPLTTISRPADYDWSALLRASAGEGQRMVRRLLDDFETGVNRFERPGEVLLARVVEQRVVGVGGLNREDEADFGGAGRTRRLYVEPAWRGAGLGRLFVERLCAFATEHFRAVTVNAGTPAAGKFYEHLGFQAVAHPRITHALELTWRGDGALQAD